MGDNHFKMLCFLLKCVLLLQLMYSINHQFGAEATQPELHERLTKIEAQNHRHENEISILKMEKAEDRKEIHKLRERVAHLEDSTFSKNGKYGEILERPKRPASFLPNGKATYDSKNGDNSITNGFYGPPTNCKDLGRLGYNLNGYYMVKGKDESNSIKMQTVYCRFHQPQEIKLDLETFIGNVEMKTKSVHFFVKEIPEDFLEGTIEYVNEVVNTGGAMNLSTGVFTAPVPGIYHFDFSAMKDNAARSLDFYLRKNGRTVAGKRMDSLPNKLVASLSASLKLKANDTVYVYALGARLYDDWRGITNFAGWLVEEDLKFLA